MKETYYIKRLEASNDPCPNTSGKGIEPKTRWLWVAVWTTSDREKRWNRYEYNERFADWELVADDYPQCSAELEKAVNKQLAGDILTQLYKRELTEFEISVEI